ncbi:MULTISPECIES: N-acetylmuramoyl-L-alanine amidase [unclassified Streptomyces]|uniref:N-acetylmuramoyl-L-alanine amidase n=1 Tax=unclassified Streptomyces TaxID=2593676 RepID=UPI00093DD4DC|nr:N-acetylmuramoyl-L-alanine amidase [Streptomyces sp. TSRI0107]OKJ90811.1 N-acetylmuramoyl-L-alanine amidase [Streptomyces sp. TSRI0107]
MSYAGPEFDPPPARRPRRRLIAVVGAALVAGALAGWLVVETTGGSDTGGGRAAASSTAGTPSAEASTPSDDEKPSPTSPAPKDTSSAASGPLKGKVVVIDPGHNPGNFRHATEINQKVDIGTSRKECDTTGTSTNDGYAEAKFTLDVAHRMRTLLQRQGATVKLTHDADQPYGPCIDERARIGNEADADAVVSLHADGSGAGNRGFHVILPGEVHAGAADTRPIVAPSRELGERIAGNFVRVTGSAPSNYVGDGTGLVTREDLGGLNLSTVPKVFIECGNMRDSKDAALLTSGAWRQKAAQGISEGIVSFLRG